MKDFVIVFKFTNECLVIVFKFIKDCLITALSETTAVKKISSNQLLQLNTNIDYLKL